MEAPIPTDEETASEYGVALDEAASDGTPLGDILPGLASLPSQPTSEMIGGPLAAYLFKQQNLTWLGLAETTTQEIARIPNVGPIRTKKMISNLRSLLSSFGPPPAPNTQPVLDKQRTQIVQAIGDLSAWSVSNGNPGSVLDAIKSAIDSKAADGPLAALRLLAELPAEDVASAESIRAYDPVIAAKELIESFDEREQATLERVFDLDGSAPTLEALGLRFNVTRERIRQIEGMVVERLGVALNEPANRSLNTAADRLGDRLGSAIPSDQLAGEFAVFPPDVLDRLILHLAGPYKFDGDWFLLSSLLDREVGRGQMTFKDRVRATFEAVEENGLAPLAAVLDALAEVGIRPEYTMKALAADKQLLVREDFVLDWKGSYVDKSIIALLIAGRPLTKEELVAFVKPGSEQGMSNQLHIDDRISKVGIGKFALAQWQLEEYEGIVPAMLDRLAAGPVELEVLKGELARDYGVSQNSVGMLASTHPVFLQEAGVVMIRPEDRPYIPNTNIEGTKCCYLIDGVWSWRIPVDRDVLRGSGRQLPEAFAAHLGAAPVSKGSLDSPVGPVHLAWLQYPSIGSLRAAARSMDAEEGDWMFVRRVRPSEIDFQILRASDIPSDPAGELRALVGAAGSQLSLEQVLADAMGLRGSINHDLAEERAALVARKEDDLVRLLDAAEG